MQWYHISLITMAIIAGFLAWNVPRALLWLSLGAFSYVTSAWWHNADLGFSTLYGATTNIIICILMFVCTPKKLPNWEMGLFRIFILMILIDALFILGFIKTQEAFGITLEIVNSIAMLLIGCSGLIERVGRGNAYFINPRSGVFNWVNSSLFSKREKYTQWWMHQ